MSLESKAKTLRELAGYVGCCENWNSSLPCQKTCDNKYVSLEEAQKEIKKYKLMGVKDCFRANMLQERIKLAKKVIDAFPRNCPEVAYDWLSNLREALNCVDKTKEK
jgi:hypothetical protein